MSNRLGESGRGERGFTLIELLVVMLIIGILAAIAVPLLLNQKDKATDTKAKVTARTLQTAMEICGKDSNGFASCDITALRALDGSIPQSGSTVDATPGTPPGGFTVRVDSTTGNRFTIERDQNSQVTHRCTVPGKGGCSLNGDW